MEMNKRLLSGILAVGLIMSTSTAVLAEPLTETQKLELQQTQQDFRQASSKLEEFEATLQKMDGDIEKVLREINDNKSKITSKEKEITSIKKDIEKAEKELAEKEEIFGKRMRAIYKSGSPGYVELLLESKNFSDLISKMRAVAKLMDFDKKIIDELNSKKKALEDKTNALNSQIEELNVLRAESEKKLAELNTKKDEHKKVLDQAKEEKKKASVNLAEKERLMIDFPARIINNSSSSTDDIQSSINTLREIRKNVVVIDKEIVNLIEKGKSIIQNRNTSTASRGPLPATTNSLLLYAYRFIGVPYVWGGTTPSGFDCSGFTSYVYRAFGYNIGRTTYDQINVGTPVSYSQLQPGDLVFTRGVEHVGIYVGDGMFVHAPYSGERVKVAPIYGFSSARRVLR